MTFDTLSLILIYSIVFAVAFAVTAKSFDEFETKIIANYASASYCDITNLESWTCSRCNDGFELIAAQLDDNNQLQFIVGYDLYFNASIVAFRGTVNGNWLRDFTFFTADAQQFFHDTSLPQNATVHKGFIKGYELLKPNLVPILKKALLRANHLIVTGHSLGGALATMAAADVVINFQLENVWLYSFGSPRTGDYGFTQVRR